MKKRISASQLAMGYNDVYHSKEIHQGYIDFLLMKDVKVINENKIEGGTSYHTLEAAFNLGFACLEKSVASDDFANSDLYNTLEKIEDLQSKCNNAFPSVSSFLPELKNREILDILTKTSKKSLLDNLVSAGCDKVK